MSGKTLGELLASVRQRLSEAGIPDAVIDARVLISGLLGFSATTLFTDPERRITEAELEKVEAAMRRRLSREPVHRILGHREFFGLDLRLSAETLEPRPDTEVLVEAVLPYLERIARLRNPRIIDFGTGTGAIALALLSACPTAQATGVDLSSDALSTAALNAVRLGLEDRFAVLRSNWAEGVAGHYDVVVSNPPYISSGVVDGLDPEVRLHDPRLALDGGADGLDAYRALAACVPALLAADGILGLEIGHDQRESVGKLFEAAGFRLLEARKDYGGNDRVLIFAR